MVTFTCQNCNSSLKKKTVETHLYKCRSPVLTCIDCLKDFDESSYGAHVTCITENEKYGGKGFIPTASMQKQKQWNECIATVLQTGHLKPQSLKEIVKFASNYPTCPRNKKKFINFCLNNKPFLKFRSSVESAFGLINEEFTKKYGNANENDDGETKGTTGDEEERSGGGKRKTISETQDELVVANGDYPVQHATEKLSKKKNKKNSKHVEAKTNGHTEENGVHCEGTDKKSKNKGKLNSSCEDGPVEINADSPSSEKRKKKKKNKDKKNRSTDEPDNSSQIPANNGEGEPPSLNAIDINADEANGVASENEAQVKMSKKEKKKLLKDKKYKAEIESIENYQKDEVTPEQVTDETTQPDKTKKKKKKHLEEEAQQASRKSKRSISEPDDKKIKLEGETVDGDEEEAPPAQKPKKFKWDQIIVEVLQGSNDQEMSLKRLSKKVCGEYINIYGERETYEDILLKFNKKVVKTPGVRVFKDKARLLIDS